MIKNLLLIPILFCSLFTAAQTTSSYRDQVNQYIAKYREFALEEQRRSGVPAAITLGQGILETQAGQSELATLANNHFGIKCKREWTGETFAHDDDAPQECFRKYPSALHSFKDHSDYLKSGKRYQSCFACRTTDYASWARELRKCGYATNPKYAAQLIKIIEDFQLQEYTYAALKPKSSGLIASAAEPAAAVLMSEKSTTGENVPDHETTPQKKDEKIEYGKAIVRDGIRGFYAKKGDVLLEYAIQYKVRYAKILEINNLPDAPLAADQFIALEKGSRVAQILSHDISETSKPIQQVTASPIAAEQQKPTTTKPAETVVIKETTTQVQTPPSDVFVDYSADFPVGTTTPATTTNEQAFNIADEVAVEEQKPAPVEKQKTAPIEEEPKDEFDRLKARFDKVVYAKPAPRTAESKTSNAGVEPNAPKPATSTDGQQRFHMVRKGDTAFSISKEYGISMKELMALNNLNFEGIKVGQKLRVK